MKRLLPNLLLVLIVFWGLWHFSQSTQESSTGLGPQAQSTEPTSPSKLENPDVDGPGRQSSNDPQPRENKRTPVSAGGSFSLRLLDKSGEPTAEPFFLVLFDWGDTGTYPKPSAWSALSKNGTATVAAAPGPYAAAIALPGTPWMALNTGGGREDSNNMRFDLELGNPLAVDWPLGSLLDRVTTCLLVRDAQDPQGEPAQQVTMIPSLLPKETPPQFSWVSNRIGKLTLKLPKDSHGERSSELPWSRHLVPIRTELRWIDGPSDSWARYSPHANTVHLVDRTHTKCQLTLGTFAEGAQEVRLQSNISGQVFSPASHWPLSTSSTLSHTLEVPLFDWWTLTCNPKDQDLEHIGAKLLFDNEPLLLDLDQEIQWLSILPKSPGNLDFGEVRVTCFTHDKPIESVWAEYPGPHNGPIRIPQIKNGKQVEITWKPANQRGQARVGKFTWTPKEDPSELEIPVHSLVVTCVDLDGKPAPGAKVQVLAEGGRESIRATANAKGQLHVQSLGSERIILDNSEVDIPGAYRVSPEQINNSSHTLVVPPKLGSVRCNLSNVPLGKGAALTIRDAKHTQDPTGLIYPTMEVRYRITDDAQIFRGLLPGTYLLILTCPSDRGPQGSNHRGRWIRTG